MIIKGISRLLLGASLVALVSCGLFKKEPVTREVDRTLIGTIDSVRGSEFALIRLNGSAMPPRDATLVSQGVDGPANLSLSGEKIGPFMAADIRSGSPAKNDAVYVYQKIGDGNADGKEGGLTYDDTGTAGDSGQSLGSSADSALR